jgi:DNA-binding transcriptional regulator YbjK
LATTVINDYGHKYKSIAGRQREKQPSGQKIIAAAVELFSRRGPVEVAVEHIADVADVGKGTIYNYFATKEDIVAAFVADPEVKIQSRPRRSAISRGSLTHQGTA